MSRRASPPLVLVACLLLVGCVGAVTSTPAETATTTVDPTATTTADPTTATATTGSGKCPPTETPREHGLPEKPDEFTRDRVVAFAKAYEEATVRNGLVDGTTLSVGVSVTETSVIKETDTGFVVHLEGGFGVTRCMDGRRVSGTGIVDATYFVNRTVVIRLGDPWNRTTDPRGNGTVVERWG